MSAEGPWIWASMVGGAVMYDPATGVLYKVSCPARFCMGMLVDLVDGRIANHDSPAHPGCDWTGVRVVPDPGLLEYLASTPAKCVAEENESGRNK